MNNTVTEMKTTLEGINSRITEAEERISDLEGRMVEFTAVEQNKEKRMKRNEDSLRDLWDNKMLVLSLVKIKLSATVLPIQCSKINTDLKIST